jgi:hypothetical protein
MQRVFFIGFLLCLGCNRKHETMVKVSLVDSGRAVRFTGLDNAIMGEISRDTSKGLWQALIPVFCMPADTDLKSYQPVQPGTYRLKDKTIVFTPDTPFVKGRAYFMRYYRFGGNDDMWDYIQGKSKLGRIPYTDLVF